MIPRISVVIACFNQTRELELTLDSFLHQKLAFSDYEVIVVDDHSQDYSARDVVAARRAAYPEANLLYVRHSRADGGSYGASARVKNIGVRLSRGEFVFFNNSEIAQAGESLSYILERMAAATGPLCLRGRVIDLEYDQLTGKSQAELERLHDATDRRRERVATADHAGLAAMPRALLVQIGGIDERFDYWGKEDLDLAARLKRAGCAYAYDERLKSFHISHPPNHVKQGDYQRMISLLEENNAVGAIEANQGQLWGTLAGPPREQISGTLIVESDGDREDLRRRLEAAVYAPEAETHEVVVVCLESHRPATEEVVRRWFRPLPLVSLAVEDDSNHLARVLRHVRTPRVAFLAAGADYSRPQWEGVNPETASLMAWVADLPVPRHTAKSSTTNGRGWLASTQLLAGLDSLGSPAEWTLMRVAEAAKCAGKRLTWPAARLAFAAPALASGDGGGLNRQSSVLALVPHFRCEQWLGECLESLVSQTRSLEGIVVIDDHSETPPMAIVSQFPQVTLLTSVENVGPYRLVQEVINRTEYDAYLFQDADDWSSTDRLEILLEEAARTGAELIGSQELRVWTENGLVETVVYPLDVSQALSEREAFPLLHPTSLISRSLIQRSGGFSTALRFGGDSELLLRVGYMGRTVNAPHYCYFRRQRLDSLTNSPTTGLQSAARARLVADLKSWAEANRPQRRRGYAQPVAPFAVAAPIELQHLAGPALRVRAQGTGRSAAPTAGMPLQNPERKKANG